MATVLKPLAHDERLSIVDHLDELRTRLIICVITLGIAFGVCFWQNHALLNVLNKPLKDSSHQAQKGTGRLAQAAQAQAQVRAGLIATSNGFTALSQDPSVSPTTKLALARAIPQIGRAADALPKTTPARVPITTGVAEPFTQTFTVAAYFALLFALPMILFQLYAFVLPAFSPRERRFATPLMLMVPFLFIAGVVFAYKLVLPPAISFLQNFNNNDFDVLIQAKAYYSFSIMTLLATGLIFQLPVGLLALDIVGIINAQTLRRNWRYAVVIIAVVAAIMPGVDPVSTMLLMVPMLLLYAFSIVLLSIADRRRRDRSEAAAFSWPGGDDHEES